MNKFIFIALKYYVIIMIFSIFVPYFNYLQVEEIFILPDDDKLKILEFNENFMLYNYRDKLIRYDLTNFDKDILLENTGEIFELIITKENDYYYINQEKIEDKYNGKKNRTRD
jgi:hypothetical protein